MDGLSEKIRFDLKWKNYFTDYDLDIATKYFVAFQKKERKYQSMFSENSGLQPITFSLYTNDYEYIDPQSLVARQIQKYEFTETYKQRLFLEKKDWIINSANQYLTKYIPLSLAGFFFYHEVIYNFNLVPFGGRIIEIANIPTFVEAAVYYEKKHGKKTSVYDVLFMEKYCTLSRDLWKKYLRYLSGFIKMNLRIDDRYIDEDFFKSNNKYDLVVSTLVYYDRGIGSILADHQNVMINFSILIYALCNLNINGNFLFYPTQIRTKPIADIVVICKKYFERVDLYNPDVQNKYKYTGTVVICQKFRGIADIDKLMKIFREYHSYDPTLVEKFKINNQAVYDIYVKHLPDPKMFGDARYIESFIDAPGYEYDFIRTYNKYLYMSKTAHVDELIMFKKMNPKELADQAEILNKRKLTNAILYATKYGFEYTAFQSKILDKRFKRKMLTMMYGYAEPLILLFKKHRDADRTVGIPRYLKKISGRLYLTNFLIDTRNIFEWAHVKKIVRYYSPDNSKEHLKTYVENHYDVGDISQAWLKMYEMIIDLELIKSDTDVFHTFHLCEAPGNFIAAIMYYIKHHTDIKKLDWNAQSLNPFLHRGNKKTAFGDEYGLIANHKNRWLWGEDNTGDITHVNNIIWYSNYIKDADLVTSDCGVPKGNDDDDTDLVKVGYAQLVCILYGLSEGKNFLAKLFLPHIEPIQVSMIYLLYQSFDELYFYKGVVNTFSSEFYVIGKGFHGINQDTKGKLLSFLHNFDKKADLFDNKYPNNFMIQYVYALKEMLDNYVHTFDRQLYYVDYHDMIDKEDFDEIKEIIKDKNREWAYKYLGKPQK